MVLADGKIRTTDAVSCCEISLMQLLHQFEIIGLTEYILTVILTTFAMFRAKNDGDIIGRPPSVLSPAKQTNAPTLWLVLKIFIKRAFSEKGQF